MAIKHGICIGHEGIVDEARRFATRWPNNELPTFTGTGNGVIYLRPNNASAPQETWTVTCATAPSPGNETWSVSGSTSGAQTGFTTGDNYSNSQVDINLIEGTTAFQVGDQFQVVIGAPPLGASEEWTQHFWDLGVETANRNKLILEGPGLAGTDQIFVGFNTYYSEPGDYYNISVNGMTGYSSGSLYDDQPGLSPHGEVPLFKNALEYWMIVNGQRIAMLIKVETTYSSFYVGFPFRLTRPGAHPYPLVAMGMVDGRVGRRYSATSLYAAGFLGNPNHCYVRRQDGVWENVFTLPYADIWYNGSIRAIRDAPPNEYPLGSIELFSDYPGTANWGVLDGLFWVPGFGNFVEDTITIGADTYILGRDADKTTFNSYFAMKLE